MANTKSLLERLFDTMPLAGVRSAFPPATDLAKTWDRATVADVAMHLTSVTAHGTGPQDDTRGKGGLADETPIWAFRLAGDPSVVYDVTCRVRMDEFKKYLVLKKLEWGYASPTDGPTDFKRAVRIQLKGVLTELPLQDKFWVMGFTTRNGQNRPGDNDLWPTPAFHDQAIIHVFVYDVDPTRDGVYPIAFINDELVKLQDRLKQLNSNGALNNKTLAKDFLFKDKLWDPALLPAPPTATVPEDVTIGAHMVRVVVACSLTPCRERDDYQPGDPAPTGRLYPHIMVLATAALDRIDAGIRFTRPETTTVTPERQSGTDSHESHSMTGMMTTGKIGNMLVTDSNKGNMMLDAHVKGPLPIWANLFNYYVIDPTSDENKSMKLKDTAIPLVYPSMDAQHNQGRPPVGGPAVGMVERDCSDINPVFKGTIGSASITVFTKNKLSVTKLPRQGAFDNIHVSPKMKLDDGVAKKIKLITFRGSRGGQGGEVDTSKVTDWRTRFKFDEMTMAPFCAHDCFHMHWRWTDNANDSAATHGFKDGRPCKAPGLTMIPENHGAFLVVSSGIKFTYLGQAHAAPADVWQCFCHHGAAYGLADGYKLVLGRLGSRGASGTRFLDGTIGGDPVALRDWALFYWVNRYTLNKTSSGDVEVVERTKLVSPSRVFKL